MKPSTARPATAFIAAVLLGCLAAAPLAGETREGAQRDQNRIVSEIRQIQAQLATLVEAQTALSEAVEALLADRKEQLSADRQGRAETMNTLERMERSVATLSEAFRDTNERLSALMADVESVREAQRRAALLGGGSGEGEDTTPPDGEEAEAPQVAAGDESTPDEGSGEEGGEAEATVLDEPSVSEIYLQADSDYLQGRYDLAFTGFERVADLGGELADNARYFMGECRLAQDRLGDALEHFVSVIDDFPDSSKVGEAWYKRGLILGRMGHESDAREIFESILDVFAGTTAARLAQRELDALPPRDPGV